MKIAIDCRFWGLENTGLGRYTMRLVKELTKIDKHKQYYLLFRKAAYDSLIRLPANFHPVLADFPEYTIREQILLTKLLYQLKPDIYHAIDLNIPVLWRGRLIVTVHDLTRQTTEGATTLPKPLYLIKRLAFNHWVTPQALHTASAIIVPSKFVKAQISTLNSQFSTKIHAIYEAPDPIFFDRDDPSIKRDDPSKKYHLKHPYLIYTGNAYPHKNLPKLIESVKIVNQKLILAIACGRNVFRDRVEKYVREQNIQDYVKFLGFVPDEDLRELYRHSLAFIIPSLSEGFGLPGLEAMASGAIVLSSNATCLPEIYGNAAIYFDPHNTQDMADKITQVIKMSKSQRAKLINHAIKHSQRFTWQKMAKEMLKIYDSVLLNQ